uniref:Uncharacterized LOC100180142 n=1 Tax=Ciona intestinalis TaxID=7719 RepID=F6VL97_CIOIN|nr:uncharacterized protein LOC100180142 [Ciona intestinalis]|eukprot:XP_009861802.2 uncharacterized protein LOC100180142 [Ciona intestinalis]
MNEITSNRYVKIENLKKVHDKFENMVSEEMVKAIPYKTIATTAIKRCHDGIENKWKLIAGENTVSKILRSNAANAGATAVAVGTALIGVVGGTVFGVSGTLIGTVIGMVKAALPFHYNLSLNDIPALKYLRSLKL